MSALLAPDRVEIYRDRLSSFNEIEAFMGELAELLTHVADTLSHHPDEVDLSPGAAPNLSGLSLLDQDWPTFARLQSLQKEWRIARDALVAAWNVLSDNEQAGVEPLPKFGATDPSRPLV